MACLQFTIKKQMNSFSDHAFSFNCIYIVSYLHVFFVFQLREYCLRLRNMVASGATKTELSDTIDTMIEEVSCLFQTGVT